MRFSYLAKRDGLWNFTTRKLFWAYIVGKNGIYKGLIGQVLKFLKPNFHPWERDERKIINRQFQRLQQFHKITPYQFS